MSFEESTQVFRDPLCLPVLERIVEGEERWQTFGIVKSVLLLMVAHTHRETDSGEEVIRIISARRAESQERQRYEAQNG